MEELLQQVKQADRICKEANVHYEKAAQAEQKSAERSAAMKNAVKKGILTGVVVWIVCYVVAAVIGVIPAIGNVLGGVIRLLADFVAIFVGWSTWRNEKKTAKEDIEKLSAQVQAERDAGQAVFDAHAEEMSFLPVDYWYPLATEYMLKVLQTGRASTLGGAIDHFEDQLHRWKVEEANSQMLELQKQQAAQLASIKTSSKVSAAANVTNAFINIANNL